MKCKHCQAELDKGVTLCPECGTENAPEEMKQGLSAGKITLLVVLAVVAIGIVIALIIGGLNPGNPGETGEPTETTGAVESVAPSETGEAVAAPTVPADGNPDDATCKGSYTVSDEEIAACADEVVATMGDAELTNADLQVYYWMEVYNFLSNYGSYASMLGMDYTQSLDTQISMDGVMTWQQYFLNSAIASWKNYQSMTLEADANGYILEQDYADYLQTLPDELAATAQSAGFDSTEAMIQADMGLGATLEAYEKYMRSYYVGYLYYSSQVEGITLTDEEVEAFFEENAESYLAKGLEKNDERYVDVRHILVQPADETDEAWAACKKDADDILNEWLSGEKTEESFAALAGQYSTDGGSNANGGLYTDVYMGQMVEPFENWCFDESRTYGDYGIVQTDYGYHVMYYVGSDPVWYATAWNDLLTVRSGEILDKAMNAYPITVDYSAMKLGNVDLAAAG